MAEIETPTMGEILREEFIEPMGISAYRLNLQNDIDIRNEWMDKREELEQITSFA